MQSDKETARSNRGEIKKTVTEESLKEKAAKGLFWGGINNGLQQILGLVFGIVLARILNPSDYGMVGTLAIFSSIATTVMDSGFLVAMTNKKDACHKDYNSVFWFSLSCGIFFYIVLFLCAPLIAKFYGHPELTSLSRLVFASLILGGLGYTHNIVLHKNLMVKQKAIIEITALFISCIVGLILALNNFSYWGLAIQSVTYISVTALLRVYFSPWRPTFEFSITPLKEMFGFSSRLLVTNIFQQINHNLFSIVLGRFFSITDVGNYTQGQKWMNMGNSFLTGMIGSVAHPALAQINSDKSKQIAAFRKLIRFGSFLSFPIMLGLSFVGEEFIVIAVGEKWLPSVPFLQLFCIWGAVYFIYHLYTTLLMLCGKSNVYMYGVMTIGISQIVSCLLMYKFGIMPMVTAYISISILSIIGWHIYVSKLLPIRLWMLLKDTLPYALSTAFSLAVAWFAVKNIENIYLRLLIKIGTTVGVYTIIMYKSNSVIFRETIDYIRKKTIK